MAQRDGARAKVLKRAALDEVIVDTAVMEKAGASPGDAQLFFKIQ